MATSRNSNTRIVKTFTHSSLVEVIQDFDSKHLIIPPHQREFCWDLPRQRKFIQSILKGYPIPSILMSKSLYEIHRTLEDGRQRITTASNYRNGKFSIQLPGRGELFYSDLTSDEQRIFDNEIVMIVTFRNATDDDRIQIFDWHQNGAPLTPGERYHAQHATPLIRFVKEQLMTPGSGYHDRAAAIWGVRGDQVNPPENFISKDKRRKWLLSATALVLGLSFGPANATKKYEPWKGFMTAEFPLEKQNAVKRDLERIFEIYEEVNRRLASKKPNKWLNPYWDIGTYTGYILYSLSARMREYFGEEDFENGFYEPNSLEPEPEEWEHIKNTWVEYMVGVRHIINENPTKKIKNVLEEKIHAGVSKARSWTNARWEDGYKRVFGLPIENTNQSETSEEYEDESEDEE